VEKWGISELDRKLYNKKEKVYYKNTTLLLLETFSKKCSFCYLLVKDRQGLDK
jgi:hypothetical protein